MSDLLLKAPLQYEPKTSNRWIMRFPDDIGIQPFHLVKVSPPKPNLSKKEMNFINTKTYVTTSYWWDAQQFTIRDYIAPSGAQALMEWFRLHAESVTGRMGYAIGYKKNLELELIDPAGQVVSKWLMVNCLLVDSVEFGELDYKSDEVLEISFTVQPDYCIHLF